MPEIENEVLYGENWEMYKTDKDSIPDELEYLECMENYNV